MGVLSKCIRLTVCAVLAAAVTLQAESPSKDASAEDAAWQRLAELAAPAADLTTMQATFEQAKHTPLLKEPLISRGQMRIAAGVQRWDTQEPHPSVLWTDGRTLRVYYPRQQSLEVYAMDQQLGRMSLTPVPNLKLLREYFTITRLESTAEAVTLALQPAGEALQEQVESVTVTIDPKTALARRVEIVDPAGERTVLTFDAIETNIEIDPSSLALTIPEGVKVSYPLGRPAEGASGQ